MAQPTSVYQYVDSANRVIYVGVTNRGSRRAAEHARDKDWFSLTAGCVIEHHATREAALEREAELIRLLRPPFNTQHNPLKNQKLSKANTWPDDVDSQTRRVVWFTATDESRRSMPCIKCNGPRLADNDFSGPSCARCVRAEPKRPKKQRTEAMPEELESRSVPFSLEARDGGDGLTLAGYAAVFNSPTLIHERGMDFQEVIQPGAFQKTINARHRVVLQFDHGSHPFFGSLPLGSFTDMREDEKGLYVEARLADNWFTQPVRDAIENGSITGMSFRFSVPDGGDVWDRSGNTAVRTINEVKLYEAGPVVWPAYEDTVVGVRSAIQLLSDDQVAQIADALRSLLPGPDEGEADPAETDEVSQRRTRKARQAVVRVTAHEIFDKEQNNG